MSASSSCIGREPSFTELGIFSAMWNEHCSYKSSKRASAQAADQGAVGHPGPGRECRRHRHRRRPRRVFKMESHNHPSFIEPYQGAATGVGGILRDVFTMGARPIACLNALRFGAPEHPKTRHLVAGVVAGIGGYGNSFGVPTVGGEVDFHSRYDGNILVNAMAVGIARDRRDLLRQGDRRRPSGRLSRLEDRPRRHPRRHHGLGRIRRRFRGEAPDRAGRRSVHRKAAARSLPRLMANGASSPSRTWARPASPPRRSRWAPRAISASTSISTRCRARSRHDRLRDDAVGKPGAHADGAQAREGRGGRSDLPQMGARFRRSSARPPTISASSCASRRGRWPTCRSRSSATRRRNTTGRSPTPNKLPVLDAAHRSTAPVSIADALMKLLGSPDLCSRRWVWEQYDHLILGNTVQRPGGDAAVVRIEDGPKGLALTTDVTPRYCEADPFEGGKQAVAEALAQPHRRRRASRSPSPTISISAIRNSPEIMGQLVGCIERHRAKPAARSTSRSSPAMCRSTTRPTAARILPTPAIGGVGLIDDFTEIGDARLQERRAKRSCSSARPQGWLGQSIYLREICGREEGAPPPVDLAAEKRERRFRAQPDRSTAASPPSTTSPMAALPWRSPKWRWPRASARSSMPHRRRHAAARLLFGEDQGRYVVTAAGRRCRRRSLAARARPAFRSRRIGTTGGHAIDARRRATPYLVCGFA